MKALAIDTSNWPLAVAVMDNDQLLGEWNTHLPKNHSLRLMPGIEALLQEVQVKPKELEGIIVAKGPGSYTGVRIGVTTAKTLAWTLGLPLIGISSLQVVAQNRAGFEGTIVPLFDARRGNAYVGQYRTSKAKDIVEQIEEDKHVHLETFLSTLSHQEGNYLFIGEGTKQHQELISSILKGQAFFSIEMDHIPRGGQLAYLGWRLKDTHRVKQVHTFAPSYLQLAEAEAKWLERQGCTTIQNGGE